MRHRCGEQFLRRGTSQKGQQGRPSRGAGHHAFILQARRGAQGVGIAGKLRLEFPEACYHSIAAPIGATSSGPRGRRSRSRLFFSGQIY